MTLDLFLSDEVQGLLDDFAALLDVRVTFFSLSGECLRRGKKMRNCDYCHMIQNELDNREQCLAMDCRKRNEVLQSGKDISYRCHAGLHECLAVVRQKDRPAGFVMMGQFRLEGDKMPEFPGIEAGRQQKLKDAYDTLPCFSKEKLQAITGVLRTLIDYITVRELAVLRGDFLRQEINKYIERHVTEDIRLPDMARKLGRSVSSISQFLRKNYHTSFKICIWKPGLNWQSNIGRKIRMPRLPKQHLPQASGINFIFQEYSAGCAACRRGNTTANSKKR